jgi:DNA polymerase IIIc chi subunit
LELARFYACSGDAVEVAARLLAKAWERGESAIVCGPAAVLERLSARLWLAPGFFAHAGPQAPQAVRRFSPVILQVQVPAEAVPLLINLGAVLDVASLRAARLFDVFGSSEEERRGARQRYRECQQSGWPVETVQVGT